MPQEVKENIVPGIAHITREDESDEAADDDMTEMVAFVRDNPCMFALMASTLQPACDHKDDMDIAQTLTGFAHVASDIKWKPKFTDDENWALSSIAFNAWKQFQLTKHGWYIEDPT